MQKKVYPQSFKDEVVKYYLTNHTISDTRKRYGIAESTLFEWCKRYNEQNYLSTSDSQRVKHWQQKELHLNKIEQKLEVLGKYPNTVTLSTDEKMAIIKQLEGQYSIHVLCEPFNLLRGTYYNRKSKENIKNSYKKRDEEIKPVIEKIFYDSKEHSGRGQTKSELNNHFRCQESLMITN